MRSAKEAGNFPYGSKLVCFMEISPDGEIRQLSTKRDMAEAYISAQDGNSRIVAVWPGNWRSDLFIIDDLEAFCEGQNLYGQYMTASARGH